LPETNFILLDMLGSTRDSEPAVLCPGIQTLISTQILSLGRPPSSRLRDVDGGDNVLRRVGISVSQRRRRNRRQASRIFATAPWAFPIFLSPCKQGMPAKDRGGMISWQVSTLPSHAARPLATISFLTNAHISCSNHGSLLSDIRVSRRPNAGAVSTSRLTDEK
jgi:hypothetical protein